MSSLVGNLFLNTLSLSHLYLSRNVLASFTSHSKIIELFVVINSLGAPVKLSVHGQSENVCPSTGLA